MFELSRFVEQGNFVTIRGNKIIRCLKGQRPFGVWENGHGRVTVTLEGERIITNQPRGIVTQGVIGVKTGGII